MVERLALRVLVADDEAPARAKVRRLLERDPDVTDILEARDGRTALAAIREAAPDLVLLDIEMPGRTGLEVLDALSPETIPHVVFITAYDEYAVRAFERAAVDYLLKPFDEARFTAAMARAKRALTADRRQADLDALLALVRRGTDRASVTDERLAIDDGGQRVLVRAADITRIEADGDLVRVHVGGQMRTMRTTLTRLAQRLDPARFARVGRGALVNLGQVHSWEPLGHGDYRLTLRDGSRVRLSRRYADAVAARLGIRNADS